MDRKANKISEYLPDDGMSKVHLVITFGLSILFLSELLESKSILYCILLFCSSLYFASLLYSIFLNQRVIIKDNKITFLYRIKPSLTGNIEDALYQVVIKKEQIVHFRFSFEDGRKRAQISPQAYKNGGGLLTQLKMIIKDEKINTEIIER